MPGIHVQWPWSQMLLNGEKTIETRGYALNKRYIGIEMALIETPGPRGKKEAGIKKSRIIGTIKFELSFKYESKKAWMNDMKAHLVSEKDNFAFGKRKQTWGWKVESIRKLTIPVDPPKIRGIVYALDCKVPIK